MNEERLRTAGIDYDGALMRFMQKQEIYERYLRKFLDDTHAAEAAEAYTDRRLDELQEIVHALKGVAGTLGLTPLYEITAEIVRDLRAGSTQDLESQIARMQEENRKIREAIQSA